MTSQRSYALDLFRGLTIVGMILVNNPGSWANMYGPLQHAEWHGWTVTDLIFPFFIIIIGIAISFTYSSGSKSCLGRNEQYLALLKRSLKLYGLGLFLALFYYNFHDPSFNWLEDRLLSVRLVGVLQRIGLVYLFSVLIFLIVPKRAFGLAVFMLLAGYWALMVYVPYPLPDGSWTAGGLVPGNNLAAYIDHHLLGPDHVYLSSTQPYASDPEGLLTTLPAIASCVGGFFIGQVLSSTPNAIQRAKQLCLMGGFSLVIAYSLNPWIPFNKNLWTPSYVLLAHGFACLFMALATLLTDHWHIRRGTKAFVVFGLNALALFVLSGIMARILLMVRVDDMSLKAWLFQFIRHIPVQPETQSLLFAIGFLLVMYLPLYWLYQKRLFWKV
jgi:predicted acyltransferase